MRKILIAICLVMATTACFAEKRTLQVPTKEVSTAVLTAWGITSGGALKLENYPSDISGNFSIAGFYDTKAGTYGTNEEGSIVPIIARQIYEHGGRFCMTQVQAAYGSNSGKFIDYFNRPSGDKTYKCQVVCEDGYSGNTCATKGYDCSPDKQNINYTKDLNNTTDGSFRITDSSVKQSSTYRITTSTEVFDYKNGGKNSDESFVAVLGVLRQNEHSIVVAPVLIRAYYNKIKWAHINDAQKKVLCAPGYTLNASGDDCEKAFECTDAYIKPCENVTPKTDLFVEGTHEKYYTSGTNKCWYFRCAGEAGFEYEGASTCVPCPQTSKQGVKSNGVCEKCTKKGQFFFDENSGCTDAEYSISPTQMARGKAFLDQDAECWRKSDINDFKSCVLCDVGQCYESNGCGPCSPKDSGE